MSRAGRFIRQRIRRETDGWIYRGNDPIVDPTWLTIQIEDAKLGE